MGMVDGGEGDIRGEHCADANKRRTPAFLGIDELAENLRAVLSHAGARTIRTVMQDRTVRLAVDHEEVAKAFAVLVRRVACGAAITILGAVVPIEAAEEHEGMGCALLSVFVRADPSTEPGPSKDALAVLGELIKKQSGSFRLRRGHDEMRFCLYLPVLREV